MTSREDGIQSSSSKGPFRVLGKGLELLSSNGGRFEVNQLLFADDTTLVADRGEVV